jgi:thioredoxin 1
MLTTLTAENFSQEVLKSTNPVFVLFTTKWAPNSSDVYSEFTKLGDTLDVKYGILDVDDNYNVSIIYGIREIPAVILFKDGQVVATKTGRPIKKVENLLDMLNDEPK